MTNKKIILASGNAHKIEEFQHIFNKFNINISGLEQNFEAPLENGKSFQENSDLKAQYYSEKLSNLILADDSGLSVDALNGRPGIYSARFSGESSCDYENNILLLNEMKCKDIRSAKFVCSLSLAFQGNVIFRCLGEVQGTILKELKGKGGFGYDPLFFYPPLNKTFSSLSFQEKNKVSHRYEASKIMAKHLSEHIL